MLKPLEERTYDNFTDRSLEIDFFRKQLLKSLLKKLTCRIYLDEVNYLEISVKEKIDND